MWDRFGKVTILIYEYNKNLSYKENKKNAVCMMDKGLICLIFQELLKFNKKNTENEMP